MSLELSILVGCGIVVLYTLLGGFWAVSLTDTLQGLLMALTAVVIPVAALIAVGGPAGLWQGMQAVSEWTVDGRLVGTDQTVFLSFTRDLEPVAGIGLVLGLQRAYVLFVRKAFAAREARRGLNVVLAMAAAQFAIGVAGTWLDLFLASRAAIAAPERIGPIIVEPDSVVTIPGSIQSQLEGVD